MKEVEDYRLIEEIAKGDVDVLRAKGQQYGRSWIKRGGVGAFMMLARKWDRIENDAGKQGYNILAALVESEESLLDDLGDLRRYLLLVEAEFRNMLKPVPVVKKAEEPPAEGCPYCTGTTAKHAHYCPTIGRREAP